MSLEDKKEQFINAFDEYGDSIFRFCLLRTGDKGLSEDLTQETFTRFWQSMVNGKEMTNSRAFLYTIAQNMIIDWYRKKKTVSLEAEIENTGNEPPSNDDIEKNAQIREVLDSIMNLEETDREILLMRYVEGLEPSEIAEYLGVSSNSVSVRIHRAVEKLRQLLNI